MKNKLAVGLIGIGVLLLMGLGIYVVRHSDLKASQSQGNINSSNAVSLDDLVNHPDRFKGNLKVAGRVIKVTSSSDSFVLGCEDACIAMPVTYQGQIPAEGTEIIAYGAIREAEGGRYIFEAQEIRAK